MSTISFIAETLCPDKMSRNAMMPGNGFKMPLVRQDLLTTQESNERFPGDPDSTEQVHSGKQFHPAHVLLRTKSYLEFTQMVGRFFHK